MDHKSLVLGASRALVPLLKRREPSGHGRFSGHDLLVMLLQEGAPTSVLQARLNGDQEAFVNSRIQEPCVR